MARRGNPSARKAYARGTQVTTSTTARETFGGTCKGKCPYPNSSQHLPN